MKHPGWSLLLGAALALHGATRAQCSAVSFARYGNTCAVFTQHATLNATYDASACVATLTAGRATTCCNTFLAGQVLFLSVTKLDPGLRHPLLVQGCVLSVVPDLVLPIPRTANGAVRLPIPNLPAKVTIYAQGLNDYLTTIGLTHDYQTTQGLAITIG